jgi:hypothetical protein
MSRALVNVTGDRELIKSLQALDQKVRRRLVKQAMKKAVAPIVQAQKMGVMPVSPTIAGSIEAKIKTRNKGAFMSAQIGPSNDAAHVGVTTSTNPVTGITTNRLHKPVNTAHLVDGGVKPHQIRLPKMNITIDHPGTKATPFVTPSLDDNRYLVQAVFDNTLVKGIERAARKAARMAAKA